MTLLRVFYTSIIFAVFINGCYVSCGDIHITCDFDLEPINLILPHLPVKCMDLYNDRQSNPTLYNSYHEEAQQFGIFQRKIDQYERRGSTEVELTEYPFDAKLREEIYSRVDIAECVTTANETAEQYIECVKDKRLQLIDLIPNA